MAHKLIYAQQHERRVLHVRHRPMPDVWSVGHPITDTYLTIAFTEMAISRMFLPTPAFFLRTPMNQVWHYAIDGREHLFRALQGLVCLFHCNELTLGALIKKLDGNKTGPRGFIVAIGQPLSFNHSAIRMTNYYPTAVIARHTVMHFLNLLLKTGALTKNIC